MDIKDKIGKLLALSESPNENEAQLALDKAQKLMIQYQLSMQDFQQTSQVVHRETEVTFSKRRASWTLMLASVIAENYCCRAFARKRGRQQTRTVCLAGFPSDVEFCERVFKLALSRIQVWIGNTVRLNRALYTTREMGNLTDSYAKGYTAGIYASTRNKPRPREEMTLVTATSTQVHDSVSQLKTEKLVNSETVIRSVYNMGFCDGLRFRIGDRLAAHSGT